MTTHRLEHPRRVAEAADNGNPWEWEHAYPQRVTRAGDVILVADCYEDPDAPSRFAEFISTFDPPTVLSLLDELQRLRDLNTGLTKDFNGMLVEVTTTADPPRGVLLRVFADGDGIMVKDTTGLRYGWGLTLGEAVEMWADCVQDCLDEKNAGGPYLLECNAYRSALARLDSEATEGDA